MYRSRAVFALPFAALLALAFAASATPARAATIAVDTLDDSDVADSACSLREAIVAADSDAAHQGCSAGDGADILEFTVTGVIHLLADLPVINRTLELAGPPLGSDGLPNLIVDGDDHRMLVMNGQPDGRTLTIRRLTLRDGLHPTGGGCVRFNSGDRLIAEDARFTGCGTDGNGGAIYGEDAGHMTLRRVTVADNEAIGGAGGVYFLGEGFLDPQQPITATFVVEDSTFSGNSVPLEASGGGLVTGFADGTVARSTISGNQTADAAGGLLVIYGYVEVEQSTITGNQCDTNDDDEQECGAGLYAAGDVAVPATVVLRSTVVAGNFAASIASDVTAGVGTALLSEGFNLIGVRDGAAQFFVEGAPNANDDWVGSRFSPVLAGLSPLAGNGGPTRTHAPSPGSLLVDHGSCPGVRADQRGYGDLATLLRPIDDAAIPDADDGCDIGAFEADAVELPAALFLDGFESGDTDEWSAISL